MGTNDTNETPGEQPTGPHTGRPVGLLGGADVRIDVDEKTYHRLHREYCRSVERGYSEGFDTFALNYCSTDCYVTVDGEPVEPAVDE